MGHCYCPTGLPAKLEIYVENIMVNENCLGIKKE